MIAFASIPTVPVLVLEHGSLIVMVGTAMAMRRSLGAWPVYLAALGTVVLAQLWLARIDAAVPVLASSLDMMFAPTLLFLLARRQIVPGLRRGQMTPAERVNWIARHALAHDGAGVTQPRPRAASVVVSRRRFVSTSQ